MILCKLILRNKIINILNKRRRGGILILDKGILLNVPLTWFFFGFFWVIKGYTENVSIFSFKKYSGLTGLTLIIHILVIFMTRFKVYLKLIPIFSLFTWTFDLSICQQNLVKIPFEIIFIRATFIQQLVHLLVIINYLWKLYLLKPFFFSEWHILFLKSTFLLFFFCFGFV